jgi:peptide-methionine (S)-S-oxide reductase
MIRRGFMAALAALAFVALLPRAGAQTVEAVPPGEGLAVATFAAGCFWCVEPPFDQTPGVISTTSGYIGGMERSPRYEEVARGRTGHTEAVRVIYDPRIVSFERLLDIFWRNVDPFDGTGQFCDRGRQYRPGIFVHDAEQRRLAEAAKAQMSQRFGRAIAVEVTNATPFWVAEEYHQDYYLKEPVRYRFYRAGCGRDARLEAIWGRPGS